MKTELRLSDRDHFGTLTIECKECLLPIIKNGKPMMPIYYKDKENRCFCSKCERLIEAVGKLREIAHQLEKWADESIDSSWSTHQVKPMRDKAAEIFAFLGRGENK